MNGGGMKKSKKTDNKNIIKDDTKDIAVEQSDLKEEQEIVELLEGARNGDNEAWEKLCARYLPFIHSRVNYFLSRFMIKQVKKEEMRDDLVLAGWNGFIDSLKNYDPENAKLITYSRSYIDGEIKKELDFQFNPMGIASKAESDISDIDRLFMDAEIEELLQNAPDKGSYSPDRRTLQIMEILRIHTDEDHSVTLQEIAKLLQLYRVQKYNNGTKLEDIDRTISNNLSNVLQEVDPLEYTEENEPEYRILYDGYKDDLLKKKLSKKSGKVDITNFSYVHLFNNEELDRLIEIICFSDILSNEDKLKYIKKLVSTASIHYRTPFWNGEKLKFNPKTIHNRFSNREIACREEIPNNLKVIQQAINSMAKISFIYNRHTSDHGLKPRMNKRHEISPYHLVVYHDNYYCIALNQDGKVVMHYRVDLMSDVQMLRNEDGSVVPAQVTAFEGLPLRREYWSPDKYLSEHFNMAFDEPQTIRIKIRDIDYTILQEWFGNHFEKTREQCEEGYDIVEVNTSPSMIVHWALQYGEYVEIMNEDIRAKIREELDKLTKRYQ